MQFADGKIWKITGCAENPASFRVESENTEEAIEFLEEIVRRLRFMETGEVEESHLLLDTRHTDLCLMMVRDHKAAHEARVVLDRMKKDFDMKSMRKKDERFRSAADELNRLTESDGGVFEEYCMDKVIEYVRAGVWKKNQYF